MGILNIPLDEIHGFAGIVNRLHESTPRSMNQVHECWDSIHAIATAEIPSMGVVHERPESILRSANHSPDDQDVPIESFSLRRGEKVP